MNGDIRQSFVSGITYNGVLEYYYAPYNGASLKYLNEVLPQGSEISIVSSVVMGFDISNKCIELFKAQVKTPIIELTEKPATATAFFSKQNQIVDVRFFVGEKADKDNEIQLSVEEKDYFKDRIDSTLIIEQDGMTVTELLSRKRIDLSLAREKEKNLIER